MKRKKKYRRKRGNLLTKPLVRIPYVSKIVGGTAGLALSGALGAYAVRRIAPNMQLPFVGKYQNETIGFLTGAAPGAVAASLTKNIKQINAGGIKFNSAYGGY